MKLLQLSLQIYIANEQKIFKGKKKKKRRNRKRNLERLLVKSSLVMLLPTCESKP